MTAAERLALALRFYREAKRFADACSPLQRRAADARLEQKRADVARWRAIVRNLGAPR
jgi:hypothetical protein